MPAGSSAWASDYGGNRHPAWYYNVKANPEVTLFAGGYDGRFRAEETTGAERERLWALAKQLTVGYSDYEKATGGREIPVIAFTEIRYRARRWLLASIGTAPRGSMKTRVPPIAPAARAAVARSPGSTGPARRRARSPIRSHPRSFAWPATVWECADSSAIGMSHAAERAATSSEITRSGAASADCAAADSAS